MLQNKEKSDTRRYHSPCQTSSSARVALQRCPILRSGNCNSKPDLWSRQRIYTQELTRAGFLLGPLGEQRFQQDWVDYAINRRTICVMCSQLTALPRVQTTFEKRAEN